MGNVIDLKFILSAEVDASLTAAKWFDVVFKKGNSVLKR